MRTEKIIDRLALFYSRVEPAGLSPKAPGTCGSAVAVLLAPWLFLPFGLWGRLGVLGFVFLSGAWAAGRAERALGRKDPGCIVIDEVLGQWLALMPLGVAACSLWECWPGLLAGFALFRFFDILKPWPIKKVENFFPDGFGVMLDDAMAGLYAALALWGLLELYEYLM